MAEPAPSRSGGVVVLSGPAAFEAVVAADYQADGYETQLTGGTNDWGLDVFAWRDAEKLAIQAKMYAGARLVNRRQVFELYGAAAYFDCTGCVVATDGFLSPDAQNAADKLGVTVKVYGLEWTTRLPATTRRRGSSKLGFDLIWERHIVPLAGRDLSRANGTANRIVSVDWGGVVRVTSGGNRQHIPIEIFRWAIERVLHTGSVTRDEINEQYPGRASSGIVLILDQVPTFTVGGPKSTISLRRSK